MKDDLEAGDGLLNRGELEIELARFALRRARRVDSSENRPPVANWIQDEATALIARVQPEHRPWTGERVRQIAESLTGLTVQVVAAAYGLAVLESSAARSIQKSIQNEHTER